MESLISTGSEVFDSFIKGYEKDAITTLYGPGGAGKTNLCIMCMVDVVKKGKKVIYVDTDGSFSVERLKQIDPMYKETMKNVTFLKLYSFEEQKEAFDKLKDMINDTIGLVVVDSIAMLYRLEFGKSQEFYEVNRELGLQLSFLSEISRKKNIPVLMTNQVYSSFDEKENIRMVGGDIVKYGSKCIIELKKGKNNVRAAVIRKHRSMPEGRELMFEIVEEGIRGL